MDRYTEARAIYPMARFHYVGHSNGTYLLAKALQDYRAVRFDHVVFAGSVVHRAYEWRELVPDRVKSVINFIATGDWVVAFFPKALQTIGIQDLGSAGHDGFDIATARGPVVEPPGTYVVGGHSAALQEAMWDGIAGFVLTGDFKFPAGVKVSKAQAWWVAGPAKAAPLLWVGIALLLGWGFYLLFRMRVREWKKTIAILAYGLLIWTVLTGV
jgi:pimeloyl-ACP methyl ester carboxylesterase